MAASIKISADTSQVKRSLLELSKSVKNMGSPKVSVFSEKDRKFIRTELNRELSLMKTKLKENKQEISKLISEQAKLAKGSKEELETRKKILDAYKQQTRLGRDLSSIKGAGKMGGSFGGMLGKGAAMLLGLTGTAALAAVAYGGMRTMQAGSQFAGGAKERVRLRGLGVQGDEFGRPEELAKAGLTEQDFIKRQVAAVSRLGRAGGSRESILGQAKFERAFGLEGGAMTNVSTSLRAQFGGKGADQAQQKLQASILAAGIEDALAPYLETATDLLSKINENGVTNTDEMTAVFAQLVKEGQRTPEQISAAFQTIDASIRGSKGEANAFLQNAFARGGIGGGTIGATKLALESGGIFGLNEDELTKRGYTPTQIKSMNSMGITGGMDKRVDAILNQFRQSGGVSKEQGVGDVAGNSMVQMNAMANSIFGTQGIGGIDALKLLDKVQSGKMTQPDFQNKMKALMDQKDPQIERLTKINDTLAGQLTVQENIRDNLMEVLGKKGGARVRMIGTEADIQGITGTTNTVGAVNDTGALAATQQGINKGGNYLFGGGLADPLSTLLTGMTQSERDQQDFQEGARRQMLKKRGNMPGTSDASYNPAPTDPTADLMATAVEKGMTRALATQKAKESNPVNKLNVRIHNGDGTVSNKTHK